MNPKRICATCWMEQALTGSRGCKRIRSNVRSDRRCRRQLMEVKADLLQMQREGAHRTGVSFKQRETRPNAQGTGPIQAVFVRVKSWKQQAYQHLLSMMMAWLVCIILPCHLNCVVTFTLGMCTLWYLLRWQ